MIVVYVLAAWVGAAVLLAWPVGVLLNATLSAPRPAMDEFPNSGSGALAQDATWADVEAVS